MDTQTFCGSARYLTDAVSDGISLLVAVECQIGGLAFSQFALLDTAAEWSVLGYQAGRELDCLLDPEAGIPIRIATRFGVLSGHLILLPLLISGDSGESLTLEVQWFFSEDWHGPTVLGWRGCLNALRFAINPDEDRFYFAAAEGLNPYA